MPQRRSRDGRPAGEIFGSNVNSIKPQDVAEFSEPYGTMSAMNDIKNDPTDPWNYIFAMPVIGDAARFGKKAIKAQQGMGATDELRRARELKNMEKQKSKWEGIKQKLGPVEDVMDSLYDAADVPKAMETRYDNLFDALESGTDPDDAIAEFMIYTKDNFRNAIDTKGLSKHLLGLANDPNMLNDLVKAKKSKIPMDVYKRGMGKKLDPIQTRYATVLRDQLSSMHGSVERDRGLRQLRELLDTDPEHVAALVSQRHVLPSQVQSARSLK